MHFKRSSDALGACTHSPTIRGRGNLQIGKFALFERWVKVAAQLLVAPLHH